MKPLENKVDHKKKSLPMDTGKDQDIFLPKQKRALLSKNQVEGINQTDTSMQRFGLQIRLRRRRAGYTPLEFSAKTGIEIEMLAAIEFGYAPPEAVFLHLKQIAAGLEIPLNALRRFLAYLWNEENRPNKV